MEILLFIMVFLLFLVKDLLLFMAIIRVISEIIRLYKSYKLKQNIPITEKDKLTLWLSISYILAIIF